MLIATNEVLFTIARKFQSAHKNIQPLELLYLIEPYVRSIQAILPTHEKEESIPGFPSVTRSVIESFLHIVGGEKLLERVEQIAAQSELEVFPNVHVFFRMQLHLQPIMVVVVPFKDVVCPVLEKGFSRKDVLQRNPLTGTVGREDLVIQAVVLGLQAQGEVLQAGVVGHIVLSNSVIIGKVAVVGLSDSCRKAQECFGKQSRTRHKADVLLVFLDVVYRRKGKDTRRQCTFL